MVFLFIFIILLRIQSFVTAQCTINASIAQSQLGATICLCNQGFYGTDASQSTGSCTQCPFGSSTATPSNQSGGNTSSNVDVSVCNICQINYYMASSAVSNSPNSLSAVCTICPSGTGNNGVSQVGDQSQCNLCLANYYMTSSAVQPDNSAIPAVQGVAAQCSPCPSGTGNIGPILTVGDISQCNQCLNNYYMVAQAVQLSINNQAQAAQCMACPTGSGNIQKPSIVGDVSQCNICLANYQMTAIAQPATEMTPASAAQCQACPGNSYSLLSVSPGYDCQCYDQNAIPLSSTQTSCVCKNGFSGNVATSLGSTGCKKCDSGQFSTAGSACVACTAGSSINLDQGSCSCNDNSTGTTQWSPNTNICQCQAGYYGNAAAAAPNTTGSCTLCPTNTSSKAGSALIASQCTSIYATKSILIKFSIISILIVILN
ncbi:immobilization antigen (macronuclear) [Tetrahymena thermophila SB210]|uniref:Immobilization antigen n=1 Tax=Tetrahymena thermophila (strain SB210) TaxID=312017 RepID=Q23QG3_TETTS|nr:immobilization antigen [Tetrahymena thermophila SB210]EAR98925.1 immobilization antigen [Tetrahymena thermophila SB210]|eukprot:XP_001019170.1 immobilization antigen [Tetrahymena thermophila SB210]